MMMPGRSVFLLLLLHDILQVACGEMGQVAIEEDGNCMHFSVSPVAVLPEAADERLEYFRAMTVKDLLRLEMMASHRNINGSSRRRQAQESSFDLPLRSALNTVHVGMYLVTVRFGTPARPYDLVLDTANDLTWVDCRLRRRKGKHYGRSTTTLSVKDAGYGGAPAAKEKNWFRPALSSSWRRIRCSEQQCAKLPYNTCKTGSQAESCTYHNKIRDGTVAIGIYGNEEATVTLADGRTARLPGLVLGCSTMAVGSSVDAHDGVLSLGNGHLSFASHAGARFGNRFSFCLPSIDSRHDASSYLTFGPNPALPAGAPGTMETRLVPHADVPQAFGPHVTGILVGGQRLDIPPEILDTDSMLGAGVILDVSTSLTALVEEVYDPVTAALHSYLDHLPRAELIDGFDYCYNWSFADDAANTVPSFTVEMEGGARLEVGAKGVVLPEVVSGVACLAFRKMPSPPLGGPSILGNVLMQDHIWEVDHGAGKIRFRKDKCTSHPGGGGGGDSSSSTSSGGGGGNSSSS